MALAINNNDLDHPAVSLLLVKDKKQDISLTKANNDTSRGGVQALIYNLMLLVGENMSKIQKAYAQNQLDQGVIAQNQAKTTQAQTKDFLAQLQKQEAAQAEAAKWATAGEWLKYIGLAFALIISALTAGTVGGFLLVAIPAAIMASPLGDKAISALGDKIATSFSNSEAGKTWGKVIAQALVLVMIVVVSAGTELGAAASKTASTVEEEAAEAATFSATKMNFVQALVSTNLLGSLASQLVEAIPGDKDKKQTAEMALSIIINLVVMVSSFAFASDAADEGSSLMSRICKAFKADNTIGFERGASAFTATLTVSQGVGTGGSGYYTMQQGNILAALAPLQAELAFGESFFHILDQQTNQAQRTCQSLMEGNRILFETNFAADWAAGARALQA